MDKDDELASVVEIPPTWAQSASMLCAILKDGTPDGKEHAQAEIIRMGRILDQLGVKQD